MAALSAANAGHAMAYGDDAISLGVYERFIDLFGDGTRAMARLLSRMAQAGTTVVVGGGDSVAAIEELKLAETFTHVSTGGGASLEFLEGQELPGIAILADRSAA